MLTLFISKLLYILFFASLIIVFRYGYLFFTNLFSEEPKKFVLSNTQMIYVCISLAVILASIFKGIGL